MTDFMRLLDPVRHAAVAFFKHDLALKREGGAVHIVLEQRSGTASRNRPPSAAERAARRADDELQLMRRQLAQLLDELPATRGSLRQLAFVEQALGRKGLRALDKLPLDVLRHALEQFEGLVTNWSPVGLATLRSKMAVAVIERQHAEGDGEDPADAGPTSLALARAAGMSLLPEVVDTSDDDALAAAYAALGDMAPPPSR